MRYDARMSGNVEEAYQRLFAAYGPQHWWPAETPFEMMVGAVLTQNTNWSNVAKALENLREEGLLDAAALHRLPSEELAELIRPAGYYRLKAGRLKRLLDLLFNRFDGSLEEMFSRSLDDLRELLLSVNGIGPETADSILLYAGKYPTFVVDTYTHRVFKRHAWIEDEADYHTLKDSIEAGLERSAPLFNEYHALLVKVGKEHCGPKPRCEGCPLQELLPPGGPHEPAPFE